MEKLIAQIQKLKQTKIAEIISKRILEFEELGKKRKEQVFSELCFCLMTAGFQAEKCINIQKELGRGFEFLPEQELAKRLKEFGHRFWPQRASRIVQARECKTELCKILNPNAREMREWLVKNVSGLGMKEASHFLRNIGYKDVAIIDFHILDLLVRENIIEKPSSITPKKYLEIENVLRNLASQVNLSLAELDLYLWYIETGKVLK